MKKKIYPIYFYEKTFLLNPFNHVNSFRIYFHHPVRRFIFFFLTINSSHMGFIYTLLEYYIRMGRSQSKMNGIWTTERGSWPPCEGVWRRWGGLQQQQQRQQQKKKSSQPGSAFMRSVAVYAQPLFHAHHSVAFCPGIYIMLPVCLYLHLTCVYICCYTVTHRVREPAKILSHCWTNVATFIISNRKIILKIWIKKIQQTIYYL